ncbi:unnamed protein product [Caenorhabditis bovis]|uniref:CX domain-containing protein n=1 Tax=Caenorhabditis bovis TaxID=2654633 RepID=A0A8S1DZF6_9PELO|nr:unnamed protein product [Caenorhabditis bovis]
MLAHFLAALFFFTAIGLNYRGGLFYDSAEVTEKNIFAYSVYQDAYLPIINEGIVIKNYELAVKVHSMDFWYDRKYAKGEKICHQKLSDEVMKNVRHKNGTYIDSVYFACARNDICVAYGCLSKFYLTLFIIFIIATASIIYGIAGPSCKRQNPAYVHINNFNMSELSHV